MGPARSSRASHRQPNLWATAKGQQKVLATTSVAYFSCENRERRIRANADRRGLAGIDIDKAIAGIVAAIEDELYQSAVKTRMAKLERERGEITAWLAALPQYVPECVPALPKSTNIRSRGPADAHRSARCRPTSALSLPKPKSCQSATGRFRP